jgi:UDP-N-acetylmuramoyl-L-alanyl-D-glutamate--2,6-diaminopimelate ligase
MKLSSLIKDGIGTASVAAAPNGRKTPDPEITGIFCRAQDVVPGGLFVAVKGFSADGHDYIEQAVANGAAAVVCEKSLELPVVRVLVNNSRKVLAELAGAFYDHPSRAMTVVGITGTNGKTTISYLIEHILETAGFMVGVIGTINYRYCGSMYDNPVTTPESLDLQKILAQMRSAGVTHAIMEISSHALDLYRVHGCAIDIGVFTNLTQDHLDFHGNMETYWACKRKLFDDILPAAPSGAARRAVINVSDPKGRELAADIDLPLLSCGQNHEGDVVASAAHFGLNGIQARIHTPVGEMDIRSPLVGRYNLENILNAVGVGIALELPLDTIAMGISDLATVPGRLERIPNRSFRHVYVDYAHTPDALENVLLAIRSLTAERIICVFGCGGDRDRSKRPKMGAVAAQLSDLAIVTSDNPRTETPGAIIEEIVAGIIPICGRQYDVQDLSNGFREKGYGVVADRRRAIGISIQASRPGDTVLIAGKGHEPYQVVGRRKLPFDDRLEAEQALAVLA